MKKIKYLVALGSKGFNHPTILVEALNENAARTIVRRLKPANNIGDIEVVNY